MKTFGGDQPDQALSIQQTNDGGYILTGGSNSFGSGLEDMWLIRLDESGDTLWTKTFGGINDDRAYYVRQTMDNGFIITGYTTSFGPPGKNTILIKTDSTGNSSWLKTFGDINRNWALSVQQTSDLGYIVVGFTQINSTDSSLIWLIKTTSDGTQTWTKNYSLGEVNWAGCVRQIDNSGYVLGGFTEMNNSRDALIIKTDYSGEIIWTKIYGGPFDDWIRDLHQTSDGGYILTGVTQSDSTTGQDLWLIKTDIDGEIIFSKTYGGTLDDWSYSCAIQNNNQGYIIAGGTYSFGHGDADAWLIKTDLSGDSVWTKTYGGTNHDFASSVCTTLDNGYIIAGGTSSFGAGNSDALVFKTDSAGRTQLLPGGFNESDVLPNNYSLSQNFPNPFNPITKIRYKIPEGNFVTLDLFDVLGQKVENLINEEKLNGEYEIQFDGSSLSSGIYFYQLKAGSYVETRKMVLMK
jgi:hypothetical protein